MVMERKWYIVISIASSTQGMYFPTIDNRQVWKIPLALIGGSLESIVLSWVGMSLVLASLANYMAVQHSQSEYSYGTKI